MLTEPKKLKRFLNSFYRKMDRIDPLEENDPRVGKAVDFLRDRFSRGSSNPRAWRTLIAMFLAGRSLGIMVERSHMKKFIRSNGINSMTAQEKIDFADAMQEWSVKKG